MTTPDIPSVPPAITTPAATPAPNPIVAANSINADYSGLTPTASTQPGPITMIEPAVTTSLPVGVVAATGGGVTGFFKNVWNKLDLYIVIILIALLLAAVWEWKSTQLQAEQTNADLVASKAHAAELEHQIAQKLASDAVTAKTIGDLKDAIKEKQSTQNAVVDTINTKIGAINAKYNKLDKTEANRIAQEQEISTERIRGLWQTFCLANPKHERCLVSAAALAASK